MRDPEALSGVWLGGHEEKAHEHTDWVEPLPGAGGVKT